MTKLDFQQVIKNSFDESTDSLKVLLTPTTFGIELDAADGDNVTAKPDLILVSNTTETVCTGIKSVVLYVESQAGTHTAKIQISPVDSGNVWMDLASSTVSADPSNLVSSSVLSIVARRIRVAVTVGTPIYHLVGHSV